jgi:hypothetical protein
VNAPRDATRAARASHLSRVLAPLAIAGNLALGVGYVGLFTALVVTGQTRGADFTAFYTGWRIVLEGHGGQLYDPAFQAEVQRTILGGQTFQAGLNAFLNPPHMVLPWLPLGLLPLDTAFLVWTALQVVLLTSILAIVFRGVAHGWTPIERAGLVAAFVAFPPLAISFFQGSFALLLVAGVAGSWYGLERLRDGRAGAFLALATIKPQGAFGAVIAALLSRRPAAIVALAFWGVGLGGAATVILGPGIWSSYLSLLGSQTSAFDRYSLDPTVMWNLRGTLALLLGRGNAAVVNGLAYLGFAIGIIAIAWLWRRGWPRPSDRVHADGDTALRVAITIVLTLLLSPHLNPHDDTLAALAVVLAYGALRGTTGGRILGIGAMLAPVTILIVNGIAADAPTTLPIRLPTLLLIAFAVVTVAGLWRSRDPVLT